ncbi:hypothetical protein ABZ867_11940 [Streptomyces cinnamoneus]
MTAKKCPNCGRPSGAGALCRDVPLGWFCFTWGLQIDNSRIIHPTPDPIGKLEQRAIDEYADRLATAEKHVDGLIEAHRTARERHHETVLASARAGVLGGTKMMITGQYGGPSPVAVDNRRRLSSRQEAALIQAEVTAREAVEEAEHQLGRGRDALNDLTRAAERARRIARASE